MTPKFKVGDRVLVRTGIKHRVVERTTIVEVRPDNEQLVYKLASGGNMFNLASEKWLSPVPTHLESPEVQEQRAKQDIEKYRADEQHYKEWAKNQADFWKQKSAEVQKQLRGKKKGA